MTETTPENEQTPVRRSLRDRTLGLRGVAAVAIASVVIGGAGGVALGAVTDGADDSRTGQFGGPGTGGGGQLQMPPGQQGQLPSQQPGTTTAPGTTNS